MQQSFIEYLQPHLWFCSISGFSSVTSKTATNKLQRICKKLLRFSILVAYLLILAFTVTSESPSNRIFFYFTNLVSVGNKVGLLVAVLHICIRAIYYRLNRKTIDAFILKVVIKYNRKDKKLSILGEFFRQKCTYCKANHKKQV